MQVLCHTSGCKRCVSCYLIISELKRYAKASARNALASLTEPSLTRVTLSSQQCKGVQTLFFQFWNMHVNWKSSVASHLLSHPFICHTRASLHHRAGKMTETNLANRQWMSVSDKGSYMLFIFPDIHVSCTNALNHAATKHL